MTRTSGRTGWVGATELMAQDWEWPAPWLVPPSPRAAGAASVVHEHGRGAGVVPVAAVAGSHGVSGFAAPTVAHGPSPLTRIHVERGVSPWLDHLSRAELVDGRLSRLIAAGVRGIGAGHVQSARALEASIEYDEQLSWLLGTGYTAQEAYWEVVATDAQGACGLLRSVYEMSQGADGHVSLQAVPADPRRTGATIARICHLHRRIDRPNLMVAIPATAPGVRAVQTAVSAGCNINATSIFSLARYAAVVEAYQSGLEAFTARGGDPTTIHGVASFSLGPVDAEVDRRIEQSGDTGLPDLRGLAAMSQAVLAHQMFEQQFSTERWVRLARRGATPQRLAWVCTPTGLDRGLAQRYVEALSLRDTVQVLGTATVAGMHTHGLGERAPRLNGGDATAVVSALAARCIDLDDVAAVLERRSARLEQDALADAVDRLSARTGRL